MTPLELSLELLGVVMYVWIGFTPQGFWALQTPEAE